MFTLLCVFNFRSVGERKTVTNEKAKYKLEIDLSGQRNADRWNVVIRGDEVRLAVFISGSRSSVIRITSATEVGNLHVVDGIMNAGKYINVFQNNLKTTI